MATTNMRAPAACEIAQCASLAGGIRAKVDAWQRADNFMFFKRVTIQ